MPGARMGRGSSKGHVRGCDDNQDPRGRNPLLSGDGENVKEEDKYEDIG